MISRKTVPFPPHYSSGSCVGHYLKDGKPPTRRFTRKVDGNWCIPYQSHEEQNAKQKQANSLVRLLASNLIFVQATLHVPAHAPVGMFSGIFEFIDSARKSIKECILRLGDSVKEQGGF